MWYIILSSKGKEAPVLTTKEAAERLGLQFKLMINEQQLI